MHREVGADSVRMPDVEQTRGHSFEAEVLDEMFRGIEGHVAQMHAIIPPLVEETGDQRADFPRTENQYAMHGEPHIF